MVFLGLVAFAVLTWIIGRRRGIEIVNRRVYGNRYSDAPGRDANRRGPRRPAYSTAPSGLASRAAGAADGRYPFSPIRHGNPAAWAAGA